MGARSKTCIFYCTVDAVLAIQAAHATGTNALPYISEADFWTKWWQQAGQSFSSLVQRTWHQSFQMEFQTLIHRTQNWVSFSMIFLSFSHRHCIRFLKSCNVFFTLVDGLIFSFYILYFYIIYLYYIPSNKNDGKCKSWSSILVRVNILQSKSGTNSSWRQHYKEPSAYIKQDNDQYDQSQT